MALYPKSKIPIREVKKFIIIFYIVGFLGFISPFTKPIFIIITPFALLLNTYLLAIYHEKFSPKNVFTFLLILLSGYAIEVVGVQTGMIFGSYSYGKGLGIKLFETPLLIGVNWLFLTYAATTIANNLKLKNWLVVFVAPLFMIAYDLVLERVAPKMDMWHWQNSEVPLKNYMAWYLIALVFVFLLKIFRIETKNPLASILLLSQFIFFALLTLLL